MSFESPAPPRGALSCRQLEAKAPLPQIGVILVRFSGDPIGERLHHLLPDPPVGHALSKLPQFGPVLHSNDESHPPSAAMGWEEIGEECRAAALACDAGESRVVRRNRRREWASLVCYV